MKLLFGQMTYNSLSHDDWGYDGVILGSRVTLQYSFIPFRAGLGTSPTVTSVWPVICPSLNLGSVLVLGNILAPMIW